MIVYGGSAHAKEIVYILLLNGINVDKILDADPSTGCIFGISVEKVSAETEFIAGPQPLSRLEVT